MRQDDDKIETSAQSAEQAPPSTPAPLKPKVHQIIGSVLAAAFGVQSKENRERDFQHGKPIVFVITGVVFTLIFILSMIAIVSVVLKATG